MTPPDPERWQPGRPPWRGGSEQGSRHEWPPPWRRRPGLIFLRFAGVFGLFVLLLLSALGIFIFLVVRLAGGTGHTAAVVWLSFCSLLLFVPLVAGWIGRRAYRSIARPLGDLMTASEKVAQGDLSVRVPVQRRGEFGQLANAFNHMVAELALADQRRRNLTADVAHELRTPLQIIQGNLEGVLDGVYAPTAEHISATLEETRLLARLVEDLRVLSQAEAGQLPMNWERVDVAELLADVTTSFSGQAQAAGVELVVTGDEVTGDKARSDGLKVQGDYSRLDQVLGNLIANALRHTAAGGRVTLAACATSGGVEIQVSDTGAGIAPEDLPYIFDRFWRGDRARAHGQGGNSGLGLAIARQLVQAHGGQIRVESTVDRGTIFTIELPAEHRPL